MNKKTVRRSLLQQRKQIKQETNNAHSSIICEKIINSDFYAASKHIAAYISFGGEIDCNKLMQHCMSHPEKTCYLPVIENNQMQFYAYHHTETLTQNQHHFLEPPHHNKLPITPEQIDLIIIPLVAFDTQGNRVGRGAGHYDRFLAPIQQEENRKKPLLIGVAHAFQQVTKITPDQWDIPLDTIITEL